MTGYLAADGFIEDLLTELGDQPKKVYGRLVVTEGEVQPVAWVQNIWLNPVKIPIQSIGDADKALRAIQRNWIGYSWDFHRRAALIQEKLPKVSAKPIEFLAPIPQSPLGSWTLLEPDLLLASSQCSSPFPHGQVEFVEDKTHPPSRAYLKLWELFSVYGIRPQPGERCLDLGSSPGGWTWVLAAQIGAHVISVDKAPLAPAVAQLPNVEYQQQSAFAVEPKNVGPVDWLFSDIICYPERLLGLVRRWMETGVRRNFVCTLKFQGPTDHKTVREFMAIPGSRVMHLSHNKHELTWVLAGDPTLQDSAKSL